MHVSFTLPVPAIHIITNRQRPNKNREKGNDMIQSTQEDASDIDMT